MGGRSHARLWGFDVFNPAKVRKWEDVYAGLCVCAYISLCLCVLVAPTQRQRLSQKVMVTSESVVYHVPLIHRERRGRLHLPSVQALRYVSWVVLSVRQRVFRRGADGVLSARQAGSETAITVTSPQNRQAMNMQDIISPYYTGTKENRLMLLKVKISNFAILGWWC